VLQTAFAEVCRDPEFLADAAKLRLEDSSVGREQATRTLTLLAEATPGLKDAIRKLESSTR
jgi:hypothetical protein